jgi:hypothetical protein
MVCCVDRYVYGSAYMVLQSMYVCIFRLVCNG